jgi:hypothetical protein
MNSVSLRAFVMFASVAFGTACDNTPVEVTSNDVTVSLTVSRTSFRQSESTKVRVTTSNQGTTIVAIPDEHCQTPFEVVRGNITVVATEQNPCIAIYGNQFIKPGESVTNEYTWDGSDWHSAGQLNPGQYTLRGKVFVEGQAVLSTPVAVEILSK